MNTVKPVYLESDKCNGCVNCMKRCPTEAIRVRDGKATIMYERCVGCGECVKVCPTGAKKETFDKLDTIGKYKYKIALPCPSLYGQFNNLTDPDYVLTGLKRMGFDAVFEVAYAAELVSAATRRYLKDRREKKPLISTGCPAVLNLILMRYEHLTEYLSPMLPPEEVAARLAIREAEAAGIRREDIGVFVIAECAAKVLQLKRDDSGIDGVLAVKEVYFPLLSEMNKITGPEHLKRAGKIGVGWGSSAGEAMGLASDNYLSADGIENVIGVLNDMEHDKLSGLDFIELNACSSGCVGGSLNVENPFLACTRLRKLQSHLDGTAAEPDDIAPFTVSRPYESVNVFKLDENRIEAMKKMIAVQEIYAHLPGINCGSCGAPNCMALAEDIVRGLKVSCKYKEAEKK